MRKRKRTLFVVVVLVALVALAGTIIAFAQGGEGEVGASHAGSGLTGEGGIIGRARLGRDWRQAATIDYDALLAEALNITTDELQQAREEAQIAALQQAVDEGVISQRQADLIAGAQALKKEIRRGELVANALGISPEALQEASQDKAFRDLLEELEMTPAEVREAVLAEYEVAVQQALEDGLITEEQADLLLSRPGAVLGDPPKPERPSCIQAEGVGRGLWHVQPCGPDRPAPLRGWGPE